jgi:hypothetical protein
VLDGAPWLFPDSSAARIEPKEEDQQMRCHQAQGATKVKSADEASP